MKILTLLGLIVLLTTSLMPNCISEQFIPPPKPVAGYKYGLGSNFGYLDCPSGYTFNSASCGGLCYRFEPTQCTFWNNARTICQAEGGDLMEPETCSYQIFQNIAVQLAAPCGDLWIGGYRLLPSLNYMTVRGSPLPNDFSFWAPNQPTLAGNIGGTHACVQMANEHRYLMSDDGCKENAGYVCQIII